MSASSNRFNELPPAIRSMLNSFINTIASHQHMTDIESLLRDMLKKNADIIDDYGRRDYCERTNKSLASTMRGLLHDLFQSAYEAWEESPAEALVYVQCDIPEDISQDDIINMCDYAADTYHDCYGLDFDEVLMEYKYDESIRVLSMTIQWTHTSDTKTENPFLDIMPDDIMPQ